MKNLTLVKVIICLAAAMLLGCGKDNPVIPPTSGCDTCVYEGAPTTITDLKVVATTKTSITIEWSAPSAGNAPSVQSNVVDDPVMMYEGRYNTVPVTEANFEQSEYFDCDGPPAFPGVSEQCTIGLLEEGTVYYFAIKSINNALNGSALSNVASGSTIGVPKPAGRWEAFSGNDGIVGGYVSSIVEYGGKLIIGGDFSGTLGVSIPYIAQWNGSSWGSTGLTVLGAPKQLLVANGELQYINGGIASWDGSTWYSNYCWGGQIARQFNAIGGIDDAVVLPSGDIVVAGKPLTDCGNGWPPNELSTRVATWNGTEWAALGSADWIVQKLGTLNGNLVMAGFFPDMFAAPHSGVIMRNGGSWVKLGGRFSAAGGWGTLTTLMHDYNGDLIVQSTAEYIGGNQPITSPMIWNGASWAPWGDPNTSIIDFETYKGDLLTSQLGGVFRLDGSNWSEMGDLYSALKLYVWNGELLASVGTPYEGDMLVRWVE